MFAEADRRWLKKNQLAAAKRRLTAAQWLELLEKEREKGDSALHGLWVVTEKASGGLRQRASSPPVLQRLICTSVRGQIHGANLCLVCDGHTVQAAKRGAVLEEGEDFFGAAAVVEASRQEVLRVWSGLAARVPELHGVLVYGELFGGLVRPRTRSRRAR